MPSKNENRSISQESSIWQKANMQRSSPRFRPVQFWGNDLPKNIVRLNPSFTLVSCGDDKEITYREVWCTCKAVVWLILMKKLLFVVRFTLLVPALPSSSINKFPFCIKHWRTNTTLSTYLFVFAVGGRWISRSCRWGEGSSRGNLVISWRLVSYLSITFRRHELIRNSNTTSSLLHRKRHGGTTRTLGHDVTTWD